MATRAPVMQAVVSSDDDYVRCGPAQFGIVGPTLEVRYSIPGRTRLLTVDYDLNQAGFHQAYRLHLPDGAETSYLVCRDWGNVHVRYGPMPEGKHYPPLQARVEARQVRLVDDIMVAGTRSFAFHPNRDFHMSARLAGDEVIIQVYSGYLVGYELRIEVKKLSGNWYTPLDSGGRPLPVRLKRPFLAKFFDARCVDVQWVG